MVQQEILIEDGLQPCPISLTSPEDCDNTELVEIDRDGDHEYFECPECGYAFGHRKIPEEAGVKIDASCQAGIPEELRRAASGEAMIPPVLVSLGSGIAVGPPK
jgi:Zn ribbon nucleic-acid-binding protein